MKIQSKNNTNIKNNRSLLSYKIDSLKEEIGIDDNNEYTVRTLPFLKTMQDLKRTEACRHPSLIFSNNTIMMNTILIIRKTECLNLTRTKGFREQYQN